MKKLINMLISHSNVKECININYEGYHCKQ